MATGSWCRGERPQDKAGCSAAAVRRAPLPPRHARLIDLQRQAGNGAVTAILSVQRNAATRESYRQRALRSLRASQDGPTTYARLVRLVGPGPARQGVNDAAHELESEVAALRQRDDVVYRVPPLTRSDGHARLAQIERKDPQAFTGLQRQGAGYAEAADDAREHEWGLGVARTPRGEAMLIIGDATGVTWSQEILACLTPVAHSHPYFKAGPARDRRGDVSTRTKEIADHDFGAGPVPGAVPWARLVDGAENKEMQKIFPSASDVAFAARKGVRSHTVYTPYLVLDHPTGRAVTNPQFGNQERPTAPRLRFEIHDASPVPATHDDYACMLVAFEGASEFWRRHISTQGAGQFSPLVL